MEISVYECQKCHHQWVPNKINPKKCPKCQAKNWGSLQIGIDKQHITVNQYKTVTTEMCLTENEALAQKWIAKINDIPTDKVFKQSGSPDFVLANGKSYEQKTMIGKAVYISDNQRYKIMQSNPDCELLVFKNGIHEPILTIPVSDIVSGKTLNTVDVAKYGQIYIKVTD